MQATIKSRTGIAASLVFLSLLPAAVVYQAFFENGIEIVTHIVLATGSALLAFAVFDFKTPRRLISD